MPRRKSVSPEGTGDAAPNCRAGATGSYRVRDGAAALQCLWTDVHGRRARKCRHGEVRHHSRGDDSAVEVWHWCAFQPDGAAGRTTGDAAPGFHAVGVDGAGRRVDRTGTERVDPAGRTGQCDAQRRHQHADTEAGAQYERRAYGNIYQWHRIDLAGVEDRVVLHRMEACGRETRRCTNATRPWT